MRKRFVSVLAAALCAAAVLPATSAMDVSQPYVVWVNGDGTIGRAATAGGAADEAYFTALGTCSVAFDANHLYWTSYGSGLPGAGTVGRANLDGSAPDPNFITGATNPCALTVDGAHIYWANTSDVGGIGRANLDGSGATQVFVPTLKFPCGLAVDAAHVYWTNRDAQTIGRADLDGGAASVDQSFIAAGPGQICGLAADGAHLYWCNYSSPGTVSRADIGGSPGSVNLSFVTGLDKPSGVAVDGTHVYWTSLFGNSIGRANLDGTSPNPSFVTGANFPSAATLAALPAPAAPPAIASFFLPKKVTAKFNATASKSALTAVGILDTGPDTPDLASAATLDIGGVHVDVPGLGVSGKGFAFAGGGLAFSVTPNPYGSSRAKFKLKYTGDLSGKVAAAGPMDLHFRDAAADGGCTVALAGGVFGLGKVRGALIAPNLFVLRAAAKLKGPGKDALSLIVGLATAGDTPPAASDLSIAFGANLSATIPAASFTRKGDVDTFAGDVHGVTKVVVDYSREQISITGKALDLGAFAQGGNPVTISVGLAGDLRAVAVRMGRIGSTMKY